MHGLDVAGGVEPGSAQGGNTAGNQLHQSWTKTRRDQLRRVQVGPTDRSRGQQSPSVLVDRGGPCLVFVLHRSDDVLLARARKRQQPQGSHRPMQSGAPAVHRITSSMASRTRWLSLSVPTVILSDCGNRAKGRTITPLRSSA